MGFFSMNDWRKSRDNIGMIITIIVIACRSNKHDLIIMQSV